MARHNVRGHKRGSTGTTRSEGPRGGAQPSIRPSTATRGPLAERRDASQRLPQPPLVARIPRLGWVLIFVLPLLLSEFMFYTAGRSFSMVLFPLAWIGFWVAMMQRFGWPVLGRRS